MKFYSLMDEGLTANAGLTNAEEVRRQAEKPVPKWKQILRKVRFRPHSWPLEAVPQGHFLQGELQETGLPDGYFDYIRIDNALEHVPNPKEVIAECRRLLRGEGGQLMVYVPHGRSLSMRFMKGNSISAWIPFHLQLFTRKSLKRLLEDAGFNPQITWINPIRIYEYNPTSWLPLSIMQWKNQEQPAMNFNHARWLAGTCYPIGWLAVKFGMGEELVGVAIR